jgi:hypothetical protein
MQLRAIDQCHVLTRTSPAKRAPAKQLVERLQAEVGQFLVAHSMTAEECFDPSCGATKEALHFALGQRAAIRDPVQRVLIRMFSHALSS